MSSVCSGTPLLDLTIFCTLMQGLLPGEMHLTGQP